MGVDTGIDVAGIAAVSRTIETFWVSRYPQNAPSRIALPFSAIKDKKDTCIQLSRPCDRLWPIKLIGERAAQMAAYMKNRPAILRRTVEAVSPGISCSVEKYPIRAVADYETVIFELWNGVHREEMYQALRVAESKPFYAIEQWSVYERLVQSSDWWDTLDWIAGKIVSGLYRKHPRFVEPYLMAWRTDDGMWVRRASLAHLRQKTRTNCDLLAETILMLAHGQSFSFARRLAGRCAIIRIVIRNGLKHLWPNTTPFCPI